MTNVSAELDTEIRRLRVRIIGLTSRQLAEAGENAPVRSSGQRLSRRETIAEALAEFSALGSGGRMVPDLGDQSLADQVVVLLDHGRKSATQPGQGSSGEQRNEQVAQLLDAAVRLRRDLA